ncbi:hypothetical protein BGX21_006946, partial [Mortierella sp. AD011]
MPREKKEKNAKSGGAKRQNPIRGSSKATSSSSSAAAIHPASSARGSNKATKSKRTPESSSSLTMANQPPSLETGDSVKGVELEFFCIVEKESTAFPVKIFSNQNIGNLKNVIKEAKKRRLDEFAADELTLYKAEIPIVEGANYKKVVDDTKKDRNNKMGPADLVREHISKVLSKTIQIVVELPKQ